MTVTRRMVQFSFHCFKIADILNIFPFTLDKKSGLIHYEDSKLTKLAHNICFGSSCIKCVHLLFALITKLIASGNNNLAVTILTGIWGAMCLTATFWSYELFHVGLSETIILFNSLDFKRNVHGRRHTNVAQLIQKISRMRTQELLLVACPYAVNIFVPIYFGMMYLFPHWSVFATSLLEPGTWAYWLSIGLEFIAAVFMQINLVFLFFFELSLQTIHFGDVDALLQSQGVIGLKLTENSLERVDESIALFHYYHVIVKLCNVLFSQLLFSAKISLLSCSIFGTYYVIKYIHSSSVILIIFFGVMSIQFIGIYMISCKELFDVPEKMRKVKKLCASLLDQTKGKITPWEFKVRKYEISAMPSIGISEGGFRYMESTSTLVFLDFFLKSVISLLLL